MTPASLVQFLCVCGPVASAVSSHKSVSIHLIRFSNFVCLCIQWHFRRASSSFALICAEAPEDSSKGWNGLGEAFHGLGETLRHVAARDPLPMRIPAMVGMASVRPSTQLPAVCPSRSYLNQRKVLDASDRQVYGFDDVDLTGDSVLL